MCEYNFKKLLCYNTIKNIPCTYKVKCLFAHNLEEQQKDHYRDLIYKMIMTYNDLSDINIYNDNELFDNLITYTYECKNCINNQCAGGYNCKYGVCIKSLKICYNDLVYGKCSNKLCNNICIHGHHLTEKKLIPYNQYLFVKNINIKIINVDNENGNGNDIDDDKNQNQNLKAYSMIKLNNDNIKKIKNILNFSAKNHM